MNVLPHIRAKGKSNGNISLFEHTDQVLAAVLHIAEYYNLSKEEKQIARNGAILHDIGKANSIFQERLDRKIEPFEEPYRHELGSLFFLPLFQQSIWPQLIDMVVAHHRSIKKDAREQGILDLDDNYPDPAKMHLGEWGKWQADALKILKAFDISTREIEQEEVLNTYEYSVDYCRKKGLGWSFWKGLMISGDHFASSLNEKTYENIEKSFHTPDIKFFFQEKRQNPLYPLSIKPVDNPLPHTLVTAPTGAGKTDFLMKRCQGRIFYTLPFQSSINAMHKRFQDELGDVNPDIRILHASSRLSIEKGKIEERALQDKVGASIKVLTPYQLASIAFATKGYEAILIDIQGCDVILDEIHTYSSYSQAIVLKVVEVLKHFNCRLHIGTATMPGKLKERIVQLLGADQVYQVNLSNEELDEFDRHLVHKLNDEDPFDKVMEGFDGEEKVLAVFNRVDRAQAFYDRLEQIPPDFKMLIHSRFKRGDRSGLEEKLKNEFDEGTQPCIVVSTQVVEVSLDISFDRMITEAAPLDALIQRFGRVNRKRSATKKRELKPVFVLPPYKDAKDALPYDADIVNRSFEALPNNEVLKERNIQKLMDEVYAEMDIKSIELAAFFKDGQFLIKELWHQPKSTLIEQMDIETTACIIQEDWKNYGQVDAEERIKMEIPVSYRSIAFKGLDKEKRLGSRPFIVPDTAYDEHLGLLLSKAEPANYKTFEMI